MKRKREDTERLIRGQSVEKGVEGAGTENNRLNIVKNRASREKREETMEKQ